MSAIGSPTLIRDCSQLTSTPPPSNAVQKHLRYAQSSKINREEGLVIDENYNIDSLLESELISLYVGLRDSVMSSSESDRIIKILIFDIIDIVLRKIDLDPNNQTIYRQYLSDEDLLIKKIDHFLNRGGTSFKKNISSSERLLSERAVKVLTCTLESERAFCGGVGAVVRGLNRAIKKLNTLKSEKKYPHREKIYSLTPLYDKDKPEELIEAHFLGTVFHKYNHLDVISSVYKNPKTGEYLIQPDPRFRKFFNIPLIHGVYITNKTSDCYHRSCYIGSAFAATCLQYTGKKGDNRVDVAQADYFFAGTIGFPLIEQQRQKGSKSPETVLIMHHGALGDRWYINEEAMRGCGVTSSARNLDAMSLAIQAARKVVFVSSQLASMALSKDPAISARRNLDLIDQNKVLAIHNGVEGPRFDPSNREIFKDLALKRTFDLEGNETTDFVTYRKEITKKLFNAGVIADSSLPLVVNIGRFDYYKGTDIVRHALDRNSLPNAQFVIMGAGDGEKGHVERLKELATTTHKDRMKVIDSIEQQRQTLIVDGQDTGVRVGDLIRVAASLYLFPSHAEACPLIGMEALCTGAPIITPSQKEIGFSLYINPVGHPKEGGKGVYTLQDDANSFGYPNHTDARQATKTLFDAVQHLSTLSVEDQNRIARRISSESLREFSWFISENGKDGVTKVYGTALSYSHLYQQLTSVSYTTPSKTDPVDKNPSNSFIFIPPTQKKITPIPMVGWNRKNVIPRIRALFREFLLFVVYNLKNWQTNFLKKTSSLFNRRNVITRFYRTKPQDLPPEFFSV